MQNPGKQYLRPKKQLGQHFLSDENIARKIVGSLGAGVTDTVVEIGPGMGVLTRLLIGSCERLILVEYDRDAVDWLKANFDQESFQIVHADILAWDPAAELSDRALFIGNLPYNISSPIFFHLLENRHLVQKGVFMVQKEVAERISASPGNKQYGILSVLMGYYYQLDYLFSVSPGVFRPPPKVMSGVFSMTLREETEKVPFKDLKLVVKTAFGQRRKTLRNSLRPLSFKPELVPEDWWGRRPEQLSIGEFELLTRALQKKDG